MVARAHARAVLLLLAGATACGNIIGVGNSTLDPLLAITPDAGADDSGATDAHAIDGPGEAPGDAPGSADQSTDAADGSAGSDATGNDGGFHAEAGTPVALISPSNSVDFGVAPCGGASPADRTVTITNVGGAPLTWRASLSATPFFALSAPTGGTIDPGRAAQVSLSAQAIPAFAVAGSTEQSMLTIRTDDPAQPSTDLPVVVTAGGAALSLVPGTAAFGGVPIGVPAVPIPIALVNVGNLPVTVSFTQPANNQFGLAWAGAPAPVVLAPAASVSGLIAEFTPASGAATFALAGVTTTGTMCRVSPNTIAMTGYGTSGTAIVQPASLDFGLVACGARGASASFAIQNTGGTSFDWTASFARGGRYTLSAAGGTLAAGMTTTVGVTPVAIPRTSATTPDLYADTLTVATTSPGDGPHPIALHETAQGAILSTSASALDFGGVAVGSAAVQHFTVQNSGNAAATVSFAPANPFVVQPQNQVVGASGNYMATVAFAPPAVGGYATSATMTVSPDTTLCSPLPPAVGLAGTGIVAGVQVSPVDLDFGLVACGQQGSAQSITLQNTSSRAFNWTASATAGASYYGVSPPSGTLPPGQTTTITVTPVALPATSDVTPDLYGGTVTVTTDLSGDAPHTVALHETAQGAILSWSPAALGQGIDFGGVPAGSASSAPIALANAGNVSADVSLALSDATDFSATMGASSVNASSTLGGSAVFAPQSQGPLASALSVSTMAVLCGPLPPAIPLTGSGQ